MEYEKLSDIAQQKTIEWSAHALEKMLEKGISRAAVKYIISKGEMIENYPDDKAFPSGLFYGTWRDNPLHVVIVYDTSEQKIFVITQHIGLMKNALKKILRQGGNNEYSRRNLPPLWRT